MKNLYFCTLLFSVSSMFSQNTDNHWKLGFSDINFATNPPTVSNVINPSNNGFASISDDNGDLLFYTDGMKVWNKNHQVMQNGNWISGANSESFQPVVIIPFPGNDKKYYIVSSNGESYLSTLRINNYTSSSNVHYTYSIVDFTNNSLGEVVPTPINDSNNINQYSRFLLSGGSPIYGDGTFKPLTVAKKANDIDYWVIVQKGKYILSYEITNSGLNETPVVSDFSSTSINSNFFPKSMFRMNQNFTKLYALETSDEEVDPAIPHSFYKFDFNNSTGAFSNFQQITFPNPGEKLNFFELSKDDTKVYFITSPYGSWSPQPIGEVIVLNLLNTSNTRKLSEFGNASSYPGNFSYLQRDKYGDILISSTLTGFNRNKYVHKIDSNDSFTNASINLNWIYLNNNSIGYMPQLINTIPVSECEDLVITANVISGLDKKEGTSIIASNTISSGAGAIYHASGSVTLTDGYNAVSGSNFRAYIEGCTGSFIAKSHVKENDKENDKEKGAILVAKLYPNPNNGNFAISLNKEISNELNIDIYDVFGKLVYRGTENRQTFNLSLLNLTSGFYIVKLKTLNYEEVLKLIKE